MDPTQVFCPNLDCPARGQSGRGNIRVHSQKERRFLCRQCGKTFAERSGTPFYRLRTPSEIVTLVLTLLAHGCPIQAIVVAFGFDERTVADWLDRAGLHCQAVHAHLVETPRRLGQVQADELRVKLQDAIVWMAMAIQVVKRYDRRRVVEVERRVVHGRAEQAEKARAACAGKGVINTAYIERRNGTFRERLASLARRTRALARTARRLEAGMWLVGTVYNFCTPHASLHDVAGRAVRELHAGHGGWDHASVLAC